MAEEFLLQAHAVVRVEVRPVLEAVHLEPLLLRRRAREPFEVAARMQALPAPVGCRKERYPDPRPVRYARAPVGIGGERVLPAVLVEIAPAGAELLLGERRRPGHPVAGHPAAIAAGATAVLHRGDLPGEPGLAEC